jgi:hypothetical protein
MTTELNLSNVGREAKVDTFWYWLIGGIVAFVAVLWIILALFFGPGLRAVMSGALEPEEDETDD